MYVIFCDTCCIWNVLLTHQNPQIESKYWINSQSTAFARSAETWKSLPDPNSKPPNRLFICIFFLFFFPISTYRPCFQVWTKMRCRTPYAPPARYAPGWGWRRQNIRTSQVTTIGEWTREIYYTSTFENEDDVMKLDPVLEKFDELMNPKKNIPYLRQGCQLVFFITKFARI